MLFQVFLDCNVLQSELSRKTAGEILKVIGELDKTAGERLKVTGGPDDIAGGIKKNTGEGGKISGGIVKSRVLALNR